MEYLLLAVEILSAVGLTMAVLVVTYQQPPIEEHQSPPLMSSMSTMQVFAFAACVVLLAATIDRLLPVLCVCGATLMIWRIAGRRLKEYPLPIITLGAIGIMVANVAMVIYPPPDLYLLPLAMAYMASGLWYLAQLRYSTNQINPIATSILGLMAILVLVDLLIALLLGARDVATAKGLLHDLPWTFIGGLSMVQVMVAGVFVSFRCPHLLSD